MIDIDEINDEIAKLEAQTQTYQTIETLAALYVVRDHHSGSGTVRANGKTPFLTLCDGEPVCEVLSVMDELMSTLQVTQSRLYDAVMERLGKSASG